MLLCPSSLPGSGLVVHGSKGTDGVLSRCFLVVCTGIGVGPYTVACYLSECCINTVNTIGL